jgi:hypothetical protein
MLSGKHRYLAENRLGHYASVPCIEASCCFEWEMRHYKSFMFIVLLLSPGDTLENQSVCNNVQLCI